MDSGITTYVLKKTIVLFFSIIFLVVLGFVFKQTSDAATFTVTNTNNSGAGSLRQAITDSNSNGGSETDTIEFDISGTGPHRISPTTNLPAFTAGNVQIIGQTQSGASCGELVPGLPFTSNTEHSIEIIIDGTSNNSTNEDALIFSSGTGYEISGLAIVDFGRYGISFWDSTKDYDDIKIYCNHLGIEEDGTTAGAIGDSAIYIAGSSADNAQIYDNLIGNSLNGIRIENSDSADIYNNIIGITADFATDAGNSGRGILVPDGATSGLDNSDIYENIIVNNDFGGIEINDSSTVIIRDNFIGVDNTGYSTSTGNTLDGVYIDGSSGITLTGNVIGNNTSRGVRISNNTNATFSSNYLGVNIDLNKDIGNTLRGVLVSGTTGVDFSGNVAMNNGTQGFAVQSTTDISFDQDLASANSGSGIFMQNVSTFSIDSVIAGLDRDGNFALGNGSQGILCQNCDNGTIDSGIFSANVGFGINMQSVSENVTISNNFIGTDTTGVSAYLGSVYIGNASGGVRVITNSTDITISQNVIAHNLDNGVEVAEEQPDKITITENSIYNNQGLGIDLTDNGVTPNDSGDTDTGVNALINFPVLTSAVQDGSDVDIDFSYDTNTSGSYTIEFFKNDAVELRDHGEGKTYLCSSTISHGGTGVESFSATCTAQTYTSGEFISATATDSSGNTSEFAKTLAYSEFIVTNTNNSGAGSLQAAIVAANKDEDAETVIKFDISGSGPHSIAPTTAFDKIVVDDIRIIGESQPDSYCGKLLPILPFDKQQQHILNIQIDGTSTSGGLNGFEYESEGRLVISGLSMIDFQDKAISFDSDSGGTLEFELDCSHIGVETNGTTAGSNDGGGISGDTLDFEARIQNSIISESSISAGNGDGIEWDDSGGTKVDSSIEIFGNIFGLDETGTADAGNLGDGIDISSQDGMEIFRNIFSENSGSGIEIDESDNTTIRDNFIGVDENGTSQLRGNSDHGIHLHDSDSAIIRDNISSNNSDIGIYLDGSNSNTIQDNYIGTNSAFATTLGNTSYGIQLQGSDSNTVTGNFVANGSDIGIRLTTGADNNSITGNYVGTNAASADLGNNSIGIRIINSATINNTVSQNTIAYNNGSGIRVNSSANNNTMSQNTIYSNTADGVTIDGASSINNKITQNSIYSNSDLGIDLGSDNLTANDSGDSDTGSNNLINFPEISNAVNDTTKAVVVYSYDTNTSGDYDIEFFVQATADSSGYGEGQTYLCTDTITHGGTGSEDFNSECATAVTTGEYITATATDSSGNTSEFSNAKVITDSLILSVGNTNNSGDGSLRDAITEANTIGISATINFSISGTGPHTISPTSALPSITTDLSIEGETQSGASCGDLGLTSPTPHNLQIILDGTSAGSVDGISSTSAQNITISGLNIINFGARGIDINPGSGNATVDINCNYIGIEDDGTTLAGNSSNGIYLADIADSTVNNNLVSGNGADGARIANGSNLTFDDNFLGVDEAGTTAKANTADGAEITGIGGSYLRIRDNLASGNTSVGLRVRLNDSNSLVTISGNRLGVSAGATGSMTAVGNGAVGLQLRDNDNSTIDVDSNTAAGNSTHGIELITNNSSDVDVTNNIVGTNVASGTSDLGNSSRGIRVADDGVLVDNNTVAFNVWGIEMVNDSSDSNTISNNEVYSGTIGIEIDDGDSNTIEGNTITDNSSNGILLDDDADSNVINQNYIGTDSSATSGIGNGADGIRIIDTSSSNTISNNTINNNSNRGIATVGTSTLNNLFTGNNIFNNSSLGIDLERDGVTANDAGDTDTGSNNLQNFPVITAITFPSAGNIRFHFSLDTLAGSYDIEFFKSSSGDEGEEYLSGCDAPRTHGGSGSENFIKTCTDTTTSGDVITATATDANNNTSEFSATFTVP